MADTRDFNNYPIVRITDNSFANRSYKQSKAELWADGESFYEIDETNFIVTFYYKGRSGHYTLGTAKYDPNSGKSFDEDEYKKLAYINARELYNKQEEELTDLFRSAMRNIYGDKVN